MCLTRVVYTKKLHAHTRIMQMSFRSKFTTNEPNLFKSCNHRHISHMFQVYLIAWHSDNPSHVCASPLLWVLIEFLRKLARYHRKDV